MMIKPRITIGIVLSLLFVLSACSPATVVSDPPSTPELSAQSGQDVAASEDESVEVAEESVVREDKVVEETEYYRIIQSDFWYVHILDRNHDTVRIEGPFYKEPRVLIVSDNLLRITVQAGTGRGSIWGYYYDIEKDVSSQVFYWIYDQYDGMVAYGYVSKVIVRDIFDEGGYYLEIASFKEPFSPQTVEPIINVEFINDGRSVRVTYVTGAHYQEVTEVFDLI